MARDTDSSSSSGAAGEPLVTVGLPVFDGERFLEEALDSLLGQEHRNLEVIVSDNASTDRTESIARAYAERDTRVRYRRNEANLGTLPNAQITLDEARGEYFMWAAHDDLWEPAFVGTLVRLLEERPDAAVAFCRFDVLDEQGRRTGIPHEIFDLPAADPFERLRGYITQPEEQGKANPYYGLFRAAILRDAGGTTLQAPDMVGADVLIVFRVLSFGDLALAPDLLFHKRLVLDAPSTDPGGGARPRLGWRQELAKRLAYFAAFEPLIDKANVLDDAQREALKMLVRKRARGWARTVRWRKLVVNRLLRPVRSVRHRIRRRRR